jgi:asparagine synthase (glutamine-hydrolysing)
VCGISGIILKDETKPVSRKVLEQMVRALKHRGPDDQSIHIDGPLGLGHARLSIIDLETGGQPLFNETGDVALICNGEIYNYRELRKDLIADGHHFRTNSDCEVLVHLWEQHGSAMLQHLRGMFAFVLYDSNRKILFGARDHFGQKPLFYFQNYSLFAFASEIKGLLPLPELSRDLDVTALDQFLFYQYVPHPRTIFQDVRQLPPGHFFQIDDGKLTIERYWNPDFEPLQDYSHDEHIDRVETALIDSIQSHMVSDVPVGAFLSGGIDSSLIVAIASRISSKPLKTFSISFRGSKHDESEYANIASRKFQTDHRVIDFQAENIQECLETIAEVFDQPLADSAVMPLLKLSEFAAKEVKVVLTGDGGDELFGGYRKYRRAAASLAKFSDWSGMSRRMFSTSRLASRTPDRFGLKRAYSRLGMVLTPALRCSYHRNYWEGWDRYRLYNRTLADQVGEKFVCADSEHKHRMHPVHEMLYLDQTSYLPDDLLLKTDYATMAHSLESRAPLLDPNLARIAAGLPVPLLVSPVETKIALRRIAERWLPPELANRPKKGFSFPIADWFRNELRSWVRSCLLEQSTSVPRYFCRNQVERLLEEHNSGKRDHRGRIYCLLTFELWHRCYCA